MRRSDKQISDPAEIHEILTSNCICRIALSDDGMPHIFPMNYGYRDNKIFLHSAKDGKKIDIIKANDRVCFEITDSIAVVHSETACNFGTRYRSVIGFGKIVEISELEKKLAALQVIMQQHTKKNDWPFPEKGLSRIVVLMIEIDRLTGKKSGF